MREDIYVLLTHIIALNLWNPTHVAGWAAILITSLLIGMVHGITPDEHTWPITFSYAIGSYSTKKGMKSGLIFSLAFTIQRAIASELAYLGLSRLYTFTSINNIIYIIVGVLMATAGLFIVKRGTILHLDLPFLKKHHEEDHLTDNWLNDPKPWMPAVHGFVAGWGFGAFALILYTVLAPGTHSAAFAWVPGAVFGIGTMLMQMIAGALFGYIAIRRGLKESAVRRIALKTAGNTLTWGGIAFVIGGIVSALLPNVAGISFTTGVKVHNLDTIGLPFMLVIFSVIIVGMTTLIMGTKEEFRKLNSSKSLSK